jgi:hypothetical protein
VTYIACKRDQAVAPEFQLKIVDQMKYFAVLDSDHSPMLSQPEMLARPIQEAMAHAD